MKTILVADDRASFRKPIESLLAARGHRVIGAADGGQALGLIVRERPDLVLLDLRMPVMDGLTVLQHLRDKPDVGKTAVLVLSAANDRTLILRAARLGISGYIWKKGLSARDLLNRVDHALAGACDASCRPPTHAAKAGSLARTADTKPRPPSVEHPRGLATGAPPRSSKARGPEALGPSMPRSELLAKVKSQEEIAPFPPAVAHLLAITADENGSLAEVARAAGHDPAIAIKVLRLANSPVYSRGDRVTTVKQAVARIGMAGIRQAILNLAVVDRFGAIGLKARLEPGPFWEHCIACGLIASDLARASGETAADDAFACGLLHDVGRLALAEALGEKYGDMLDTARELGMPTEQAEARVLHIDHAGLLEQMLGAWGCPREILDPARFHHAPESDLQSLAPGLAASTLRLKLADRLAHALLIGNSGNETISPTHILCRTLRITGPTLRAIQESVQQRTDEVQLSLLMTSNGTVWQRRSSQLRRGLPTPLRPLFLGAWDDTDAYRMFCDTLAEPDRETPPNVAIMHIVSPKERPELVGRLLAAEQTARGIRLPLVMLSSTGHLLLNHSDLDGRPWRTLPTPTRIASLLAAVSELLGAGAQPLAA